MWLIERNKLATTSIVTADAADADRMAILQEPITTLAMLPAWGSSINVLAVAWSDAPKVMHDFPMSEAVVWQMLLAKHAACSLN